MIKLNNDADLRSNGPGARIDGVAAANPAVFSNHCQDGGDSGAPAYQGTQIIGMNRALSGVVFEFVKLVLYEINSPSSPFPVGKGFVVTNN
ncbi:hypothetical protein B2J88_52100 [Rhodococcus sp. SRB_17]|nr:hypothetical protein [Rhodococcus sp. SRB_17]